MDQLACFLADSITPPPRTKRWHGAPTASGAVARLSPSEALWRPAPKRKCIWELVLHIAYWRHAVVRHFLHGAPHVFPRSPSNWPRLPACPDEAAWRADRNLLAASERAIADAVRELDARELSQVSPVGRHYTRGELAMGVALHDAHHVGQIQLMKRLLKEAWKPAR